VLVPDLGSLTSIYDRYIKVLMKNSKKIQFQCAYLKTSLVTIRESKINFIYALHI
jgi:hypothetical protein